MHTVAFLLVSTTLGVDIGWQPLEGGGFEYIIQVEPHVIGSLQRGQDIGGDIPAAIARNIRSFRVTQGAGRAPRVGDPSIGPPEPRTSPPNDPPEPQPRQEPMRQEQQPASVPPDPAAQEPDEPKVPFSKPLPDSRYPALEQRSDVPPARNAEEPPALASDRRSGPPQTFEAEPGVQPINHAAGFRDEARPRYGVGPTTKSSNSFVNTNPPAGSKPAAKSSTPSKPATATVAEADKPWFPFTMAVMGLFVSLGGNMYLGSLAWSYRNRCLALMGRTARSKQHRRPVSRFDDEDEEQDVRAVEE